MGSLKKELVVARYNEDSSWLLNTPIPCSIYNHGERLTIDHPLIDVIDEPNRGRESSAWLSHIVRNYHHLADTTLFVQAEPHQPYEELWQRVEVVYEDTYPLTRQYLDNFPDEAAKALDKVEFIEGLEVRWADINRFGNRRPDQNREWLASVWKQFFASPQPEEWTFIYCAMAAVPRKRITDRPLEYWRWLHHLAISDDNKIEMTCSSSWAFECVWLYLWSDAEKYVGRQVLKTVKPIPSNRMGCGQCGDRERLKKVLNR